MINAFPPPGLATPNGGTPRPLSAWPMGFGAGSEKDGGNASTRPRKAGRRCCGMPCWLFLLLQFLLVLIVAAAIVIPLYFLVIKKNNDSSASLTPLQQCQVDTATACQNGGVASLSTGSCSCICINGFTGSTCTTADSGACSAITLKDTNTTAASVMNATLGDAIPRLITSSASNFSIPLSETVLLSRFNTADLSCVSQNALVTFNGQSTRIGAADAIVRPSTTTTTTKRNTPPRRRRQATSPTTSSENSVATADSGIIFDSTTTIPLPPSSDSTISTASTAVPATALFNITQEVLDFSRVAVLYLFQEESLDNAVLAQSNLQRFYGLQSFTNAAARNVSLGQGNSVDLLGFRLALRGAAGVVGAKNIVKRSDDLWSVL